MAEERICWRGGASAAHESMAVVARFMRGMNAGMTRSPCRCHSCAREGGGWGVGVAGRGVGGGWGWQGGG